MYKFIQVNIGIIALLSIFYTYISLIKSSENLKIFLIMYFISLVVYFFSRIATIRLGLFKKRPMIQLCLLYAAGILIGLLMTCFSYGFILSSVLNTLQINLIASPLFILVLVYWRRRTKQINLELIEFKEYLSKADIQKKSTTK